MRRFRSTIGRMFHSRAGGTLACVLLASLVGGVALANPGAFAGGGPGRARVEATRAASDATGENGRRSETVGGSGGAHSVAECRVLVTHLSDELARGDASGLRRAVDPVVSSCRRHEDARGLLLALDRLILKLGEHLEEGPALGGAVPSTAQNDGKAQAKDPQATGDPGS